MNRIASALVCGLVSVFLASSALAKEIKTDFPSRKLSLYCHWAEEVWNSSFPSLLESNGMIKCEIK